MSDRAQIAIVGLGTMGCGIAEAALMRGLDVRVIDSDQPSTREGLTRLRARVTAHVRNGLVPAEIFDPLDRVEPCADYSQLCAGIDIVVEAVPEEREIKFAVLAGLSAATPDAVIASNTSALPIEELASAVTQSGRFIGIHFFNPAEWIPGVEIIPGRETSAVTASFTVAFAEMLGKQPVVVRSSPGFLANRLQLALFAECLRCLNEGLASAEQLDIIVRSTFGFRLGAYGPFAIADMAGLDVYASILRTLIDAYGDRFDVEGLDAFLDGSRLGLKTGSGFYKYSVIETPALLARRDNSYARLLRLTGPGLKARPEESGGQIVVGTPEEQQRAARSDHEVADGSDHDVVVTAVDNRRDTAIDGGE